ncbi:MAG: flagellar hook-length control protein FliK [Armatimonadetes bacterium]|nr:flagellar hook-length control protein FliK [Armatimonadota bacterium]
MDLIQLMGSPSGNRFEPSGATVGKASETVSMEAGKEFSTQLETALDGSQDQEVDPSGLIAQMVALDLNLGRIPIQPVADVAGQGPGSPTKGLQVDSTSSRPIDCVFRVTCEPVLRLDSQPDLFPQPAGLSIESQPDLFSAPTGLWFNSQPDLYPDPTGARPNPFGSRGGSDPFGQRPAVWVDPTGSRPQVNGAKDGADNGGSASDIDQAVQSAFEKLFEPTGEVALTPQVKSALEESIRKAIGNAIQSQPVAPDGDLVSAGKGATDSVPPANAQATDSSSPLGGMHTIPLRLDEGERIKPIPKPGLGDASETVGSPAPVQSSAQTSGLRAGREGGTPGADGRSTALPGTMYRGTGQGRPDDQNGFGKPNWHPRFQNIQTGLGSDPSQKLNGAIATGLGLAGFNVRDVEVKAVTTSSPMAEVSTPTTALTAAQVIAEAGTAIPKPSIQGESATVSPESDAMGVEQESFTMAAPLQLSKQPSASLHDTNEEIGIADAPEKDDKGKFELPDSPTAIHATGRNPQTSGDPAVDRVVTDNRTADHAVRDARAEIAQTVADLAAARRPQSVKIQLTPLDLGTIDISVKGAPGRVDVDLRASDDAVRQSLANHRADLVSSIEAKGTSVGSMNVGSQSQNPNNSQGQGGQNLTRDDFRTAANLAQIPATAETHPARQPSYQAVASGRVDLAA